MSDPSRGFDETIAASSVSGTSSASLTAQTLVAGRYEILSLLGAGGMGTVYKARDVELDEIVALKVLRRELVRDAGMLDRFRREVKLARRVTHKNVARSHDIGEHDGEKFLTMEYVEGEPLSTVLARDGRLPIPEVVRIATAICEGLAAAHQAGVVHRDLKPDNVLVASDGRVVITDFGIARAHDPGSVTRTQGLPVGTPAYMAPEQVEGAADIDGRADIYALGVILYELFTGRVPWQGDSPYAVAAARLVTPPPDPRARGVSDEAARIVMRCLERRPEARYASAQEVAEALATVPRDATVVTPPTIAPPTPSTPRPATLFSPVPGTKSVAVLPLRNGGPADDEYLADGLTEDLIDLLSTTPGLRVRPRGTVMHLRGVTRDVREVGNELGVDVVVEGSVRKAGAGIRVTVRVLSVADGFQLWAKRFDRNAADVLAVSDEVAEAVAGALTVEAQPGARPAKADPAALDLFLRARHEYHRFDAASSMRAVELLDEARAIAPNDPQILTAYTLARVRLWFFGGEGSAELAREVAERAVALAPDRGDTRCALAAVKFQEGDLPGAIHDLRRALVLSPALADAHDIMGRILAETGPASQAIHHLETAARLDPEFAHLTWSVARVRALTGAWKEANRLMDGMLDDEQRVSFGWITAARLAAWQRDESRIRQLLAHPQLAAGASPPALFILHLALDPEPTADVLSVVTRTLGAAHTSWRTLSFLHQAQAEVALAQGKVDEAFAELEAATNAGLIDVLFLDGCPIFDRMRDDPRWAPIRARVGVRVKLVHDALRDLGVTSSRSSFSFRGSAPETPAKGTRGLAGP